MYSGALSEASNKASYIECVEVLDQETGEPIDLSHAQEIVFQVIAQIYQNFTQFGYGLGFGGYTGAQMITASLSNGKISIIQPGIFQVYFTRSDMNTLPGGEYNVGVTIVIDDITTEIIIGELPIREGIVTVQAGI